MKRKKFLGFLLALGCLVTSNVAFASCDMLGSMGLSGSSTGGEHTHTYATSWTNNATHHWRAATCGCDEVKDQAPHTFDAENVCTACGFDMQTTAGIVYEISGDNMHAEVVGYDGAAKNVKIANTYNGLPVTAIRAQAFYEKSNITSVVIPDGVTTIGDDAFYACSSLTSVVIPDSVTSIGLEAFAFCDSLTSVIIPDSVLSIGKYAFFACKSLTSINVADTNINYKSIDGNLYTKEGDTLIQYAIGKPQTAFAIPDGVTSIGLHAFSWCEKLNNVAIPVSVRSIENSAFYGCESLTSVAIPSGVTSIGPGRFLYAPI